MVTIKKQQRKCSRRHPRYKYFIFVFKGRFVELAFCFFYNHNYISPMKIILSVAIFSVLLSSCNFSESATVNPNKKEILTNTEEKEDLSDAATSHWKGTFSNGMKGAAISFDVEGNQVKDLAFKGYWRCDGKLELTTIGPSKGYAIKGTAVDGTIKESGFYFEVHGNFNGNKASGTLRFAFVAGGCDTYKLNWTAEKQ
jgi:hypothetical protein